MEFYLEKNIVYVVSQEKVATTFNMETKEVLIEDLSVSHPGEFEKAGILLEVREYQDILFYSFSIDGKHLLILPSDEFELSEKILSFFGDVDVLILPGSKKSVKIFENIEARVVIPYGQEALLFLSTLGQHTQAEKKYKLKTDLSAENTEFVLLEGE